MIEIKNLFKTFQSSKHKEIIFSDLSLTIPKGEFATILGPNGCGKSTLFNLITRIDNDYQGNIEIEHNNNHRSEKVAYMLQKDLLLPWLTVYQNIKLGLKIQKKVNHDTDNIIDEYLHMLNIQDYKSVYPSKLSGGQRQKVALIRTLVLDTDILLLDEPFSAIDYNTRLELQATIFKYAERKNTTVVLITHDIDEAIAVSDRIIIFSKAPSKILLDLPITLNIPDRSPVTARQLPNFSKYYYTIYEKFAK